MRIFGISLLLWLLAVVPAQSLDWATLPQPEGTFVGNGANPDGVYAPTTINALLGGFPPFDSGTQVTLIRTDSTQQFIRFYNPTDPANPSNAIGSWMMPASEVRGLTAQEVRDKFALPALPTNMVQVKVPTGYALYTGIAAPIVGWGDGGGVQNRAMANKPPAGIGNDPWIPAGSFVNAQAWNGAAALSYKAVASGSVAALEMGTYMDSISPVAHSDLNAIYDALDDLVMSGQSASVEQAMGQFSPAAFDALNTIAISTVAIQADVLDGRAITLAFGLDIDPEEKTGDQPVMVASAGGLDSLIGVLPSRKNTAEKWDVWVRGSGEYVQDNSRGVVPYTVVTGSMHCGMDKRVRKNLVFGLSAGLARSRLDWNSGGDSHTNTVIASSYAFWNSGSRFLTGDLSLTAALTDVRRDITTAVTERIASSTQTSAGSSVRLRAGKYVDLAGSDWTLIPAMELGYGIYRRNGFTETGAGDLNLDVQPAIFQTLRTEVELAARRHLDLEAGVLIPEVAVGWVRDTPLNSRTTRASFKDYSQGFKSVGDNEVHDNLLLRLGVSRVEDESGMWFSRYSAMLRERFMAHTLDVGYRWNF